MMTFSPTNYSEPEYGMLLPADTISLTESEINWAVAQSHAAANDTDSWQVYLNAMARIALQQWLEKRSPELLGNAEFLNVSADELCQIDVGAYRLYLVATDAINDSEVALSNAAITAEFSPHYYVLIEVFEELQQVRVCGYLSQSQLALLLQNQTAQSAPTQATDNRLTWLSVSDFDLNADRLLLRLSCLEPESVEATSAAATPALAPTLAAATAAAVNVRRWLQDQVDQAAQELAWILLPPIPAMRDRSTTTPFLSQSGELRPLQSPTEEFNRLISDLIRNSSLTIPPQTRGAYRDWQWESLNLRLYVATWDLPLAGLPANWALLLVLAAQPGSTLPLGLQLQVRDETQVLEKPILENTSSVYLYAQVIGTQDEQFWATISLPNGAATTLAPFTFSNS